MTLIATGIIDDLPTPLSQLRELAVEEGRARAALKTEGIVRPRSAPRLRSEKDDCGGNLLGRPESIHGSLAF